MLTTATEESQLPATCVIDFWAPWCGPCRTFKPTFEAEAATSPHAFVTVNVDEAKALATKFGVRSIPFLVVISEGTVTATKTGSSTPDAFRAWLAEHLG